MFVLTKKSRLKERESTTNHEFLANQEDILYLASLY